ncbi:hypothetical protein [Methylorubrum aminovorans]
MAVRQNRYRREARSIGVPADCPETHRLVEAAEQDTAALADLERLVSLTMRFMADEQSGRPADADASSPSGRNLLARAITPSRVPRAEMEGQPDAPADHRQSRGRRLFSACFPQNAPSLLLEHRVPDSGRPLTRRVSPFFAHATKEALPVEAKRPEAGNERAQHQSHSLFAVLCYRKPGFQRL